MLGLPYHSQGRGQVERANKTTREVILALAGSLNKSQADVINLAQFISNSIIRTYHIDTGNGPIPIKRSAYEMTYGQLPNLSDNELLAAYPDRSRIQETIKHIQLLVGKLNHAENERQQAKENKVVTDLQPGELVLARMLPRGAKKLGNKYRRNIYKITQ